MITPNQIATAVEQIARATHPERILLFGSHARGDSDLDLLLVEKEVADRAAEMVRLRPLRIPADILVYSQPGSALFCALREGRTVYS